MRYTGIEQRVVDGKTATGIELKGKELGLDPSQFESFPHFKVAVMRAALKSA